MDNNEKGNIRLMIKKILLLILSISMLSCKEDIKYPAYALTKITYIPKEQKEKHTKFITETIRAASQQMTGGDYEDVDQTIIQAERTADNLFQIEILGLRKNINENYWDSIEIKPEDFNMKEKKIFEQLNK